MFVIRFSLHNFLFHAYNHETEIIKFINIFVSTEATPFLRSAQKALVTHLLELPSKFSLTALLDMWVGLSLILLKYAVYSTELKLYFLRVWLRPR